MRGYTIVITLMYELILNNGYIDTASGIPTVTFCISIVVLQMRSARRTSPWVSIILVLNIGSVACTTK